MRSLNVPAKCTIALGLEHLDFEITFYHQSITHLPWDAKETVVCLQNVQNGICAL